MPKHAWLRNWRQPVARVTTSDELIAFAADVLDEAPIQAAVIAAAADNRLGGLVCRFYSAQAAGAHYRCGVGRDDGGAGANRGRPAGHQRGTLMCVPDQLSRQTLAGRCGHFGSDQPAAQARPSRYPSSGRLLDKIGRDCGATIKVIRALTQIVALYVTAGLFARSGCDGIAAATKEQNRQNKCKR